MAPEQQQQPRITGLGGMRDFCYRDEGCVYNDPLGCLHYPRCPDDELIDEWEQAKEDWWGP